ncbi:MAG: leucine-rich repeat domain-containing protein, partial [Butyrivibrio sp.]|nr:leucine-rich repeat domain-containing protein [Butyrivibrio sp.]
TAAKTVAIVSSNNQKKLTVPATVKVAGEDFTVTSIGKKAFSGKKIKKVVIDGTNLKSVHKNAFKGSKNLNKVVVKNVKKNSKVGKQIVKAVKRANSSAKVVFK